MSTTARLGFDIVATDHTGQAFNSAKKLLDGVQGVQKAVNGFAGPMRQAERSTAAFGSRIQNVSFQVSDFAVQVSGGTDATRALAQQMPQLLGGLGVFGAVAGAAAAILLPLVASLAKTRDYAKELADGLGKLDDAQKITNTSLVDLTEQYGRYARVISDVAKTQEALAKDDVTRALVDQARAISDLNAGYMGTAGAFGEVVNQWKNADFGRSAIAQLFSPLDETANKLNFLTDKFGLTEKAARGLMVPFQDFQTAVKNTNTEAAALALEQFSKWIIQNRDDAASAIPILDQMRSQFMALSRLSPPSKGSMGFSFTPTTPATGFNNYKGDTIVAEQLAAIEQRAADAKKAVAEASRLAAEAQRRETSEFEQFIATVDHGVTPIQRMQDILRQAQEDFAHFGDKMNPEQIAAFTAYVADLNTKIGDLTFKEKWEQMAEGIQTATDAMTPFRTLVEDVGQGLEDSLVNNLSNAFSAFLDGTESAKDALRSFAASFVKEITAMIAKALILYAVQKLIGLASGSTAFGSFTQSFGGVYGDGGVFSGGKSVKAFAGGGIVNGPTLFPMTGGAGLMGEAGAEAIVPLTRQNGKLGVGASPVNVQVNNYAGAEVQTRKGNDGQLQIDIVRKVVADDLARGGGVIAQGIERGYGLRRAGR